MAGSKPGHDMSLKQWLRYRAGVEALGCAACPGTGNAEFCGGIANLGRSGRSCVTSFDFPSSASFAPVPTDPKPKSELQPLTKTLAAAVNATPNKYPLNLSMV